MTYVRSSSAGKKTPLALGALPEQDEKYEKLYSNFLMSPLTLTIPKNTKNH
jgi:hypothetical protein